jgi:ribosomal protein S18 acetylase RimI-like enzyme
MDAATDDLRLLRIDLATCLVTLSPGRFERENDRDHSAGPRFAFLGCQQGNVFAVRSDVDHLLARDILALAADEPPWSDPAAPLSCLTRIADLLSIEAPVRTLALGLIFRMPHQTLFEHPARIVRGDTPAGEDFRVRLADSGFPPSLLAMGFKDVGDLWPPWCATLDGEEIAALAFAARLGDEGAEVGVATAPEFRRRGFAAAATAAWSRLPALGDRALFYSTQTTNRSSQRVAARLGLRQIGSSLRVA